ncbi:hypothetical protein IW261DRAFT_1563651 [Armillaria novae-zelandiae]|uniref:Glucose receptor Git3 N-terminal domain-containing protein n=1 Tax=Armillaria novae-zelandiae TaxID=153914 RepID=A0AA39PBU1_9AGAR|nr:hypothetical protein IW261DRAFT_1563651 [Armillaria novae-zelandiae]
MPAIEINPTRLESTHTYDIYEFNGVLWISISGAISLLAAILALLLVIPRSKGYKGTHILGYFVSLLISNVFQSSGTVMNARWLSLQQRLSDGILRCAIKQAGNVGNAIWSLNISIHLFNILFLRWTSNRVAFVAVLTLGWGLVIGVVIIGPTAIQVAHPTHYPYFGISGSCAYPREQRFLEYLFEYISAGTSFILYTSILLRVRGNLVFVSGMPHLRFVPRGQSWKLSILRDFIDSSMLRVVHQMVWHPVNSCSSFPIGLARLSEFAGVHVPEWAVLSTAVVFNLTGFVNVLLLLATRRLFPDTHSLPKFKPRKTIDFSISARNGITPFMSSETGALATNVSASLSLSPRPESHPPASPLVPALFGHLRESGTGTICDGPMLSEPSICYIPPPLGTPWNLT